MASAIKNEKMGGLVAINCVDALGQLTLSTLIDFPKHIDTMSKEKSILCFKG